MSPETAAAADINQRRHLTILFSDLSESTRIAASMEPEDYAELLQQLRDLCEQIIPRHGGEIVRIDGDGVLCIFGYPVAHDDAARRATEAALDLHNAASALDQSFALPGTQIRLHSGIHSGVVLVRPGDIVRGRFEMLGDATNVAARLCDRAAADEVLVSAASLGADLSFFTAGPPREIRLSGRGHGLSVYPVSGREPTANRFAARVRRGVAPFAGRAAQIARLDALLDECRAGVSRLAVLVGPAGIGKTRLANEFLDRATRGGATGLLGYCEAYLGARPLQPFVQILSALAGVEPDASNAARVAESLIPLLAARLAEAAPHAPMILSIDDWQWADDAARRLLDAIRAQTRGPLLILLSTRDDDPALAEIDGATIIPVPPFAPDEAVAAIEGLVTTPDPFLVDRIRDQSGGSPLFIEELCHATTGEHGHDAQGDRNAWLDMLIQTRFARLSADEAALVNTAAVIGHMVPGWLFEAVTGLAAGDLAMRNLASEDFLYEGETPGLFRFKHGITRDAVYRTVGLRQRRILHGRVAAALHERGKADSEEPYFEALAYHHDAAGDDERAVHYAVLAGDKAMAVSALDRAQAHYRQAIEGLLKLPDEAGRVKQINRAIHRFGLACVADPSPDQLDVLAAATSRAAAMHNVEGTTMCNYWQGTICYGLGDSQASIAHLERAMATNESLASPRMAAQLKANLGQSYSAAGNYPMAELWLDSAIPALKESVSPGMETGLAYALACRGFLYADQGRFTEAAPFYAEADRLLEGSPAPLRGSVVTQQAALSIWQEDYDAARAYAEQGIEIGRSSRSRYYVMMSLALRGFAKWRSFGDVNAVYDLEKAAQWFMSGASRQRTSLCFGWLAEIMADQGRIAETRFYGAQALRRARVGDRLGEAVACRALARVAAQGFGPRPAAHYLGLAEKSAIVRQSPRESALNRRCAAELSVK